MHTKTYLQPNPFDRRKQNLQKTTVKKVGRPFSNTSEDDQNRNKLFLWPVSIRHFSDFSNSSRLTASSTLGGNHSTQLASDQGKCPFGLGSAPFVLSREPASIQVRLFMQNKSSAKTTWIFAWCALFPFNT